MLTRSGARYSRQMKAPTIKDVARRAGVSVATVSRVVNDYKWVSPELRSRVKTVIDELDYRPNYSAYATATGKSNTVVALVPDVVSPYFAQFASIFSHRLMDAGYACMFFQTQNNVEEELSFFHSSFVQSAAAIVSVTDGVEDELLFDIVAKLHNRGVPLLFLDRSIPSDIADSIANDNISGMRTVVQHLYNKGHRRIGMILGRLGLNVVKDKIKGFNIAMQELGLPVESDYIRFHDWSVDAGRIEAAALLDMEVPPTAIIACNNYICEGALSEFKLRGLKAGVDISIVGMEESDSDERLFSEQGISTIKLDSTLMAQYSADYILEHLSGQAGDEPHGAKLFPMEFTERNSVVQL